MSVICPDPGDESGAERSEAKAQQRRKNAGTQNCSQQSTGHEDRLGIVCRPDV